MKGFLLTSATIVLAFGLSLGGWAQAVAYRAETPPKIDGDLAEWVQTSPLVLDREEQVIKDLPYWAGPDDSSGTFYLMWDEMNLYLGAYIVDDVPFVRFMPFGLTDIDGIVFYLSTNPNASPDRILYDSTDFRIVFAIDNDLFDTGIDRDKVLFKKGIDTKGMGGYEATLSDYEVALVENEQGYVLEMRIGLSCFTSDSLPLLTLEVGMELGFNLELLDLDTACPGSVATWMVWHLGNPSASPREWGTLRLEEKTE